MKYKPRPGVVKTKICDENVLIPMREASDVCTRMLPLPKLWAATWDAIATDYPLEKSIKIHMMLTRRSEQEVKDAIERFCKSLTKQGFLIEVPEEEEQAAPTEDG